MCGRFTQLYSWPELVALYRLTMPPVNLQPSYNICPTDPVDVLLPEEGGGLDFVRMRWGLVPYWWSKPLRQVPATFNARSDTVATKPMFRDALKRRRCVIPISGFYEWRQMADGKQPFFISTAWLGGTQRFMGRQARIGFHAAYLNQDGHAVETGTGNALLGAYLNKLGLPDRAVVFITQSSPESMTWLSPETALREGIDVSLFPPPENKPAAAPPQVAPPATKSKEPKAAPPKAAAFTPPPGQLPYLFDQIKKPAYRASLNAVMAGRVDLPPWVLAFVQTGDGVATPGKIVQLGSGSFELYSVCQPHNCWGNYLHVLYSPAGGKAWALVTQDGIVIALLGSANPEQKRALFAADNR